MLITILFWYLILTMSAGALVGAIAPIWGAFPAQGPLGRAALGAIMGPAVLPLLGGGLALVGFEFAGDLVGRIFGR